MKKKIKLLVSLMCVLCMIFISGTAVFANEESDRLSSYEERLEEINAKLGTSYKIADAEEVKATGWTYEQLIEYYTSMSLDEFEDYIVGLHENTPEFEPIEVVQPLDTEPVLSTLATQSTQKFYYSSSNNNYLFITTNLVSSGGVSYYNNVLSYGRGPVDKYPYYSPTGLSYTPSSDSRQLTCTFKCARYISAGIIDTGSYSLKVTFTAGGGDLRA